MAKAAFIAAPNQRTAYINANVLDGTEGMEPLEGYAVVVEGQRIVEVAPTGEADFAGCELVDLKGAYLLPGLINMHVHLAGNGKPQKKQRDNEALVKKVMANGLTRAIAYRVVTEYARLELHSGVTTIRTVGGLGDFDTRVRDAGAAGRLDAPRILAANQGISVPGGHMAGSVAIAARSIPEALAQVDVARAQGADLIKLMITGGVLDAKEKGTPGELKMDPAMVRAVCDRAHELRLYRCRARRVYRGRARRARGRRRLDRARRRADRPDHGPFQEERPVPLHHDLAGAALRALRPLRLVRERGRAVQRQHGL